MVLELNHEKEKKQSHLKLEGVGVEPTRGFLRPHTGFEDQKLFLYHINLVFFSPNSHISTKISMQPVVYFAKLRNNNSS